MELVPLSQRHADENGSEVVPNDACRVEIKQICTSQQAVALEVSSEGRVLGASQDAPSGYSWWLKRHTQIRWRTNELILIRPLSGHRLRGERQFLALPGW